MAKIIIDLEKPLEEYIQKYINKGGYNDKGDKLYCYPDKLVEAVKNGIVLDDVTNGEAIMTLFPDINVYEHGSTYSINNEYNFNSTWWNAPYKGGSNGKAYIDR